VIITEVVFKKLYDTPSTEPVKEVYAGIVTLVGEPVTVTVAVPLIDADVTERGV
jgi:hypothetical protein